MDIDVNYWAVLVCGIVSMVLGFVWYGPLFGKKWMEIVGATDMDKERRKEMQKGMWKLYLTSFVLALLQACVLARFLPLVSGSVYASIFWLWAGLVVPVLAGASMWNNDSARISWARFLIQSGYYLVLLMIFGFILGGGIM